MLPLVYALLPDKLETSQTRVLEAIKDVCVQKHLRRPDPATVIMDFEKGMNNAVATVFPDAELRLCLFHLKQSAFRKIQNLGLAVQYRDEEDDTVRMAFWQILGVAFVPVDDVEEAFHQAKENIPDEMKPFPKYFEETYVLGRVKMIGKSHPTIFNLVKEFENEEADVRVMMAELDGGRAIRQPQRQKYRRINERLQNLTTHYAEYKEEGRIVDFTRACGHNFCAD
ncbi:PKS-NRPS hybrid synthetase [Frankliniella fusca]|uniref:PKS-NRPS hybrid synthetase n=1 Tax=Frankliniella fusca TaxID=407009 RepID=A0AAE1LEA6_9NEOP|nr:PKS-NRPS hybrid synthetase [Frankliniella fusca]